LFTRFKRKAISKGEDESSPLTAPDFLPQGNVHVLISFLQREHPAITDAQDRESLPFEETTKGATAGSPDGS
jgi:hypothetical protein